MLISDRYADLLASESLYNDFYINFQHEPSESLKEITNYFANDFNKNKYFWQNEKQLIGVAKIKTTWSCCAWCNKRHKYEWTARLHMPFAALRHLLGWD